jgi:ATP-dependent exoDNAse (exonuclease V) beta subunit
LANVLQLVDQARRFEAAGATSFRAFVQHLADAAQGGEAQEAPVVEEGTEGVRMMTVHKAKGLEFPVVILADPTAPLSRFASRHVDPESGLWAESLAGCAPHDLLDQQDAELERDRQEEVRLVYVAATRARDLLVVPALGDEQQRGWLEVLNPAIYPPVKRQRRPSPAPGCPASFGPESVLERPAVSEVPPHASVAPGLHAPAVGEHRVVWWDPGALKLDLEHHYGARQRLLVEAADSGSMGTAGQQDYELWRAARELELQEGAIPTVRADTVTALALEVGQGTPVESGPGTTPAEPGRSEPGAQRGPDQTSELEAVEVCRVETDRSLGGRRFGTLVHAVLASAPLDADEATARIFAEVQGRMLGASDEEVAGAARAVAAALQHPVMQLAGQSPDVRRETPVLLSLSPGHLAEGVVDLAFKEPASSKAGGRWVVVDFKTDQEIDDKLAEYRGQVLLYQQAIGRATGKPTRGVLLLV